MSPEFLGKFGELAETNGRLAAQLATKMNLLTANEIAYKKLQNDIQSLRRELEDKEEQVQDLITDKQKLESNAAVLKMIRHEIKEASKQPRPQVLYFKIFAIKLSIIPV